MEAVQPVSPPELGEAAVRMIMLVEEKFGPVPSGIRVVQEFGDETVVVESKTGSKPEFVHGTSMFLEGPTQAFVDWLKPFDGVWTTNNPMVGTWKVVHVPEEQQP